MQKPCWFSFSIARCYTCVTMLSLIMLTITLTRTDIKHVISQLQPLDPFLHNHVYNGYPQVFWCRVKLHIFAKRSTLSHLSSLQTLGGFHRKPVICYFLDLSICCTILFDPGLQTSSLRRSAQECIAALHLLHFSFHMSSSSF